MGKWPTECKEAEMKTHHQAVYQQFDEQANAYLTSTVHAQGEDLLALQQRLQGCQGEDILDLGCGAGHASFCAAPWVKSVTAYDLSDSMLNVVAKSAQERQLTNITTSKGTAEQLPFADNHFDRVISRYSAHHWHDVEKALREVHRVLKVGGKGIFIDVVSPGHPLLDIYLQTVEVLRDTSHIRDYSAGEWSGMFNNAGLFVSGVQSFRLPLEFTSWVERMRTPKPLVEAIRQFQNTLSDEAKQHFAVQADGSFTSDVMLFEFHRQ
ncbi:MULTISPECIES: class I SAM-dependent methyltransferase [Providencia]|uniref:class I SAM-dependent methyltransferase n=2 Tax=Morganellaceae TaxID=1903414 RepID=UPI001C5BA351|nr:class I SAM-dependent methyltransferase [Providencia rettgeri]ELR5150657.1 class I SAM-dependent methyltransferase [Providencia rettgeri]MDR2227722.1 class I SAM-dependent methyltransferase [Providencia sp.]QXX85061.1 class I SAM-dependent methyltransferase [Providencia sp. R33]